MGEISGEESKGLSHHGVTGGSQQRESMNSDRGRDWQCRNQDKCSYATGNVVGGVRKELYIWLTS